MPRGSLNKDVMKCEINKIKNKLQSEICSFESKELANKYLNLILDKIEEYSR